jgi:hypothetical protein
MYMPAQQENGIPRIFIQAKKEDKQNDSSCPDDDDEVVVLSCDGDRRANCEDTRKPAAVEHKNEQVIEIL